MRIISNQMHSGVMSLRTFRKYLSIYSLLTEQMMELTTYTIDSNLDTSVYEYIQHTTVSRRMIDKN